MVATRRFYEHPASCRSLHAEWRARQKISPRISDGGRVDTFSNGSQAGLSWNGVARLRSAFLRPVGDRYLFPGPLLPVKDASEAAEYFEVSLTSHRR